PTHLLFSLTAWVTDSAPLRDLCCHKRVVLFHGNRLIHVNTEQFPIEALVGPLQLGCPVDVKGKFYLLSRFVACSVSYGVGSTVQDPGRNRRRLRNLESAGLGR